MSRGEEGSARSVSRHEKRQSGKSRNGLQDRCRVIQRRCMPVWWCMEMVDGGATLGSFAMFPTNLSNALA